MATAQGITPGTSIGIREAGRKYRIDHSLLSRWARSGRIARIDGKLDESSLLAALAEYKPHSDNLLRNGNKPAKRSRASPPQSKVAHDPPDSASSRHTTLPATPDLLERFYASHPSWSPRTREFYDRNLLPFAKAFKRFPASPEPLEGYLTAVHAQATPTGYYHLWRCLRTFYRWAGRRYLVPNPMELIDPPRQVRKLPDYYTEEELRKILLAARDADDPQDYAMIRLLIYTGIRAGELASLRPEQVFPDHIQVVGKTGEGVVPIDPGTYEVLKLLLEQETAYVFPARAGGGLNGATKGKARGKGYKMQKAEPTDNLLLKRALHRRVSRIIRSSGVQVNGRKAGPHVLRHSFARLMLARTGDLRLVQRLLRHTTIVTTQIYTHLAQEDVNLKYQEQVADWLQE